MLDQNNGIFRQQRLERIHHAAEVVHGIRRIKKHKVETVVRALELRYGGLPIHQQQAAAVVHPQLAAIRFLYLMRLFVHIHQHGGCSPPADRLKRHCAAA